MSIRLTDKEWTQTLKQLEIPSGPFTQDVLLTSRVNTLMDHNGFYNLRAHVARCSPPCVNWAWEFLFRKRWIVSMRIGMSGNDAFLTQLSFDLGNFSFTQIRITIGYAVRYDDLCHEFWQYVHWKENKTETIESEIHVGLFASWQIPRSLYYEE